MANLARGRLGPVSKLDYRGINADNASDTVAVQQPSATRSAIKSRDITMDFMITSHTRFSAKRNEHLNSKNGWVRGPPQSSELLNKVCQEHLWEGESSASGAFAPKTVCCRGQPGCSRTAQGSPPAQPAGLSSREATDLPQTRPSAGGNLEVPLVPLSAPRLEPDPPLRLHPPPPQSSFLCPCLKDNPQKAFSKPSLL